LNLISNFSCLAIFLLINKSKKVEEKSKSAQKGILSFYFTPKTKESPDSITQVEFESDTVTVNEVAPVERSDCVDGSTSIPKFSEKVFPLFQYRKRSDSFPSAEQGLSTPVPDCFSEDEKLSNENICSASEQLDSSLLSAGIAASAAVEQYSEIVSNLTDLPQRENIEGVDSPFEERNSQEGPGRNQEGALVEMEEGSEPSCDDEKTFLEQEINAPQDAPEVEEESEPSGEYRRSARIRVKKEEFSRRLGERMKMLESSDDEDEDGRKVVRKSSRSKKPSDSRKPTSDSDNEPPRKKRVASIFISKVSFYILRLILNSELSLGRKG
jgi:hypothetical protein